MLEYQEAEFFSYMYTCDCVNDKKKLCTDSVIYAYLSVYLNKYLPYIL